MTTPRIANPSVVTGFSFAAMFFLGLGVAIVGAAARNAGIAPDQVGLLLATQHTGFFLSVAFAGALADRSSKTAVLAAGSLVLAVGFGGFYLWPLFGVNIVFMFLVGIGIGTYEGTTDALLLDLHPARKSLFINLNHFFVTMGSLVITVYLIFLQMAWRVSMTQSAIVVAALAVLFGLSRAGQERKAAAATSAATTPGADPAATSAATTPGAGPGAGPAGAAGPLGSTLRSPVIWLLIVSIACAVGIELGSIGLLTTYLMELRGFTQVTSKVGLLLFIGGFGIGRVVLAGFIRDDTVDRWVLGYFAASILTTALLYVLRVEALLYAMTMLSGLSVSVLLPSIIASAGQRFPDQAGTAIGIIKLGIPVGGMLLPFLSSLFTRLYSFQTALLVFPAAAAVGVACMFVVVKMPRQAARNSG